MMTGLAHTLAAFIVLIPLPCIAVSSCSPDPAPKGNTGGGAQQDSSLAAGQAAVAASNEPTPTPTIGTTATTATTGTLAPVGTPSSLPGSPVVIGSSSPGSHVAIGSSAAGGTVTLGSASGTAAATTVPATTVIAGSPLPPPPMPGSGTTATTSTTNITNVTNITNITNVTNIATLTINGTTPPPASYCGVQHVLTYVLGANGANGVHIDPNALAGALIGSSIPTQTVQHLVTSVGQGPHCLGLTQTVAALTPAQAYTIWYELATNQNQVYTLPVACTVVTAATTGSLPCSEASSISTQAGLPSLPVSVSVPQDTDAQGNPYIVY